MFKIFQKVLGFIVLLLVLILLVGHPLRGGKKLGVLGDLIIEIANVPQTLKTMDSNPQALDLTGDNEGLVPLKEVDLPLLSGYELLYYQWPDKVQLYNFDSKQVVTSYPIDIDQLVNDGVEIANELNLKKDVIGVDVVNYVKKDKATIQIIHPVIDGGDLIFHGLDLSYMYRIDTTGKVLWVNKEGYYHHSAEVLDSFVYSCAFDTSSWYSKEYGYRDDAIFVVDKRTGETVSKRSISAILDSNGLLPLVLQTMGEDPIHLNDIQPIGWSSEYWEAGDIGLSFRNLSFSCIYRPSNDSIIWMSELTTLAQHDIDFVDSNTIRIFDNNMTNLSMQKYPPLHGKKHYSKIIEYDLANDTILELADGLFSTKTQGRSEKYKGFTFVEETNEGRYYIISAEGDLLQKFYIPFAGNEKKAHFANWVRLYRKTDNGLIEN